MGMSEGKIRVLSLVIIKKDSKVLVCPGFDKNKDERFYRLIGGGVEFGEHSLSALKREIKEELDVELANYVLLSVLENVFMYEGRAGHEVCFVYSASFKDKANYQRESFKILDCKDGQEAVWLDLSKEVHAVIYPSGAEDICKAV
jgi:ADP-ribose pyrophosphatase YjhB (NUDIX family)